LLPGGSADSYALSIEWSLVYEVVFYLVFGLLAFGGKRWILSGATVWLVACLVKLFASHGFHAPPWPRWGGIALSAFNLYFLAGVLTYHLRDYGQRFRWFVPLILPVLLIMPYIGYDQVVIHLSRAVAAALVVWYAANSERWKAGDALVRYGDLTYGLYLVHAPVIVIADTLVRFSIRAEASDTLVLFIAGFSLALGASYGWIELCFYRWLRGRVSRKVITEPAAGQEQRRAA
jgi:peptidoglycan/LPS O-acetylase OafA/YrhL